MSCNHSGPSASVLQTTPPLDSRQGRRGIKSWHLECRRLGAGPGTPLMSYVTYPLWISVSSSVKWENNCPPHTGLR